MSLNQILAISESVGINDQRVTAQVTSRNQRVYASEYLSVVPFRFTMKPHNYLQYSQYRSLLNDLRVADRTAEQYLNFGATGWLNYIKYQGDLNSAQVTACNWQTASANKTLVLGSLPAITGGITSSTVIVRAGDFCQVGRYTYIATADVLRGSDSTVNIPVHRSLIVTLTSTVGAVLGELGTTANLGGSTYTGVTFPVLLQEYPTYTLRPFTNDSFIEWSGQFTAIEAVL